MSQRIGALGLSLLLLSSAASAQAGNPLTANAKLQFGALSGFVVRSAEKVPEDLYSFQGRQQRV